MKHGWLLFQYAPPDLKLSRAEKRELRRRTWKAYQSTPSSMLITLVTATFLGGLFAAAVLLLDRLSLSRLYYPYVITGPIVLIAITWITNAYVGGWIYARAHHRALRDMGHDVCTQCGYLLQGLPVSETQCPECGAAREQRPASTPLEQEL